MTNTLRSRIAAALQYADRRMALEDEMPVGAYYASLADAVIRELDTALDVAVTYLSVDKLRREFCVEGQEGIRPMSDTLRTRIAAVLGANSHMSRELQDRLADAVIEALNLDVAVTYLSVDKLRREFCVEGQEGIRPMSDTLRTRIAAVLGANSHMSRELQDHLADAVIEALRLHRNDEEDEYGGYKPTGRYRYVTEWETE